MANLASVGSHAINGVAAYTQSCWKNTYSTIFMPCIPSASATRPMVSRLAAGWRWPTPVLAALITRKIGDGWITNLDQLRSLENHINDPGFLDEWRTTQHAVKQNLVDYIAQKTGTVVDPASMFDTMVKRIHEYKRQHLKVLHIVTLYNRIKRNPSTHIVPRTFLFGGKAAPGYFMAKLIIKLINSVAEVVNTDSDVAGRLRVVFLA